MKEGRQKGKKGGREGGEGREEEPFKREECCVHLEGRQVYQQLWWILIWVSVERRSIKTCHREPSCIICSGDIFHKENTDPSGAQVSLTSPYHIRAAQLRCLLASVFSLTIRSLISETSVLPLCPKIELSENDQKTGLSPNYLQTSRKRGLSEPS